MISSSESKPGNFATFIYRALYDTLPNAGTLLAFDPFTDNKTYNDFEVPFREYCYDNKGGRELFMSRRPSHNCDGYEDPSLSTFNFINYCMLQKGYS